jgi:hypothetical protein
LTNRVQRTHDMTSQTEKDKRIDEVAEWIVSGIGYTEVLAKTCTTFKVCDRTARSYIAAANAIVREARMTMKETTIIEVVACLKDTYHSARRENDHSAATGAIRELVKLLGLAEAEKQEVKHDVTDELGEVLGIVRKTATA